MGRTTVKRARRGRWALAGELKHDRTIGGGCAAVLRVRFERRAVGVRHTEALLNLHYFVAAYHIIDEHDEVGLRNDRGQADPLLNLPPVV